MQNESTITPVRVRQGVLTLTGYGIRVTVERGHLHIESGRGRDQYRNRFPRTTRDLKRLVIIGHSGTISFDALRWLHDIGCAFMQVDADGTVIATSAPIGSDDARLRRAQALAISNEAGITIARDLLYRKLSGQAITVQRISGGDDAAYVIRDLCDSLATAKTYVAMRVIESEAAVTYWQAWADVSITYARKMRASLPAHWQRFGTRTSPLTNSPRTAANPVNAILNYCYAMLEAETRIALLTIGLDPGLGFVHADQRNRDSFACDVMEAARPAVDAFVLDYLRSRAFGREDFFETRQGVCRLLPPVTTHLAATAPQWAVTIAPVVEAIVHTLMHTRTDASRTPPGATATPVATPLTQANRRAGRAAVHRRNIAHASPHALEHPGTTPPEPTSSVLSLPGLPRVIACQECGTILDDPRRRYCDACLPAIREEQLPGFAASGIATLAARRAAGDDPAHGGDASTQRGSRNAAHHHANAAWEEIGTDSVSDPEAFTRDILPCLQATPLKAMAEATGLSQGYCSFIRRGIRVPHRRHWHTLATLVNMPPETSRKS